MANKRLRSESLTTDDPLPAYSQSGEPSVEAPAHTPKYAELEIGEDCRPMMECTLPPHKALKFWAYNDYETHYNQAHTNRCRECRRNFPTAHFLDLHLAENHDPIVAARRDRGEKTLACLVEGCDKLCSEWTKRRSHLVDKHGFPRNYDFFVVQHGIDGRRSMLRPGIDAQGHRKSSRERSNSSATETTQTTRATSESSPVEDATVDKAPSTVTAQSTSATENGGSGSKDDTMDGITKSMSSLHFVPSSITFGKRKAQTGFARS